MGKVWFTSDLHFAHANIMEPCQRPWTNTDKMDEALIERFNACVSEDDSVYILGDFAWKTPRKYLRRLNGKLFLIRGNHDFRWKRAQFSLPGKVVWVKDSALIHIEEETTDYIMGNRLVDQWVYLSHYPHRVWPNKGRGTWHLYGHVHGSLDRVYYDVSMDVGVDAHNYMPVSVNTIHNHMLKAKGRYGFK